MITDAIPASSSIIAGVLWVQNALLGTISTSVAIICVAGVGYQFLTGRIPVRRAMTVILGCFILFGAPGIAAALRSLAAPDRSSGLAEREPAAPQAAASLQDPSRPQAPSRSAPDPFSPYGSE